VVIDVFSRKFGLTKKPKYIFGISAGAAFAIKFPMTYPVNGVISGEQGSPICPVWLLPEPMHLQSGQVLQLLHDPPILLLF
jgi:hypothetical protein